MNGHKLLTASYTVIENSPDLMDMLVGTVSKYLVQLWLNIMSASRNGKFKSSTFARSLNIPPFHASKYVHT